MVSYCFPTRCIILHSVISVLFSEENRIWKLQSPNIQPSDKFTCHVQIQTIQEERKIIKVCKKSKLLLHLYWELLLTFKPSLPSCHNNTKFPKNFSKNAAILHIHTQTFLRGRYIYIMILYDDIMITPDIKSILF